MKINKSISILTIAFVCNIMLLLSCNQNENNPRSLYDENFHPFPNVLIDLESSQNMDDPAVQTFLAYRQKDYQSALNYSDQIKNLSLDDPIQLYRGVCYLSLGKPDKAKKILMPITQSKWEHKDAANWYLALAALQQNQLDVAKQRLKQLTNESTYIRNEATVLLSKVISLASKENPQ